MIIEAMERRELPYMVSAGRVQTLLTCAKPKKGMQCYQTIGYIRLGTRLYALDVQVNINEGLD